MLKLNGNKTEVFLFATKHNLQKLSHLSLEIEGLTVKPVTSVKNLGVNFDSIMAMDSHINYLCKISYFQLRNISQIRRYLTYDATALLINGLITSKLDYCNSLLFGLTESQTSKIQKVQNTAARVLTKTSKFEHITPILSNLHWLPIKARIEFKIIFLTFKTLHGMAPTYLCDLIQRYEPRRSLRSRDSYTLQIPRIKTTYGERSFSWAASKLWNNLPSRAVSVNL